MLPESKASQLPTPADLRIRRMEEADLAQAQIIDRLSFSLPWPVNAFQYEVKDNASSIPLVAELPGANGASQVIGLIVAWMVLDEVHIATISIHPEYRRRGVSRRLLAAALEQAIPRGAILATLEVRAGNLPAQALYRRFGFQVVGERPRYYQDNREDALIMTVEFQAGAAGEFSYLEWLRERGFESETGWSAAV